MVQGLFRAPCSHPLRVVPAVGQIPDGRSGPRRHFGRIGKGICLFNPVSIVARFDVVLVERPWGDAGYEPFPDPRTPLLMQGSGHGIPVIELPDDRYGFGIRGPDRELDTGDTARPPE